jgi:TRAP-type C4-dicarboxylate transport system permease small subunit
MVGRKFFDLPIFGYIDIVEIMMAFMVFLALAYTERLGHIRMELFVSALGGGGCRCSACRRGLGLAIVAVLLVYSDHAMQAPLPGRLHHRRPDSLWPSKLVVPIALGMLFVRLLVSLWAYVRVIIDPSKHLIGVPEAIDAEEQALREAAAAGAFDDEGSARRRHTAQQEPLMPIELSRDAIGILGCIALLLFVLAGVSLHRRGHRRPRWHRHDHRLEGGRGHGRHHPALEVGQLHAVGAAAFHFDRLPRLPRRHDADLVRGPQEMARLVAWRPGGVDHLRRRRLLGRLGAFDGCRCRVCRVAIPEM